MSNFLRSHYLVAEKYMIHLDQQPYSLKVKFELKYVLININLNKSLIFASFRSKLISICKSPITLCSLIYTSNINF